MRSGILTQAALCRRLPAAVLALCSVASMAGDLNGDGFDDLVVGAMREDGTGAAHVYLGGTLHLPFRTRELVRADRILRIGPGGSRNLFGFSMAMLDLNLDGRDDLVVGIPGGSVGNTTRRPGALNTFRGVAQGVVAAQEFALPPGVEGGLPGLIGWEVRAGDFNGDGRREFVAGGTGHPSGDKVTGALLLYRAPPAPPVTDALPFQFTTGTLIYPPFDDTGPQRSVSHMGAALAVADIDGDGADDVIAAALDSNDSNSLQQARLYLYRGLPSAGPQLEAAQVLAPVGENLNASPAVYRTALATGDFDADGHVDVALGAEWDDSAGASDAGAVWLFEEEGGLLVARGRLDAGALGQVGAGDGFGHAVLVADFDRDGFDDLAIGVPRAARREQVVVPVRGGFGGRWERNRYRLPPPRFDAGPGPRPGPVYRGIARGDSGAVRGWRAPGPYVPGPRDEPDWYYGWQPYEPLPRPGSLAPRRKAVAAGLVHLYLGSAGGLEAKEVHDQKPLGMETASDRFGSTLASGDYNGDGFPELAVGAPSFELNSARALPPPLGEVFVFSPSKSLAPRPGAGAGGGKPRGIPATTLFLKQKLVMPGRGERGAMFGWGLAR